MRVRDEKELTRIFQEYGMVMHSSVWDQKLYEGELRGKKHLLLRIGKEKLGLLNALERQQLMDIDDVERLDRMAVAVIRAATWEEVLSVP